MVVILQPQYLLFLRKILLGVEICYILFGSNMGDKNAIFECACQLINNRCGRILTVSSPYESEPWGFEAEEWFLNRLIVLETDLAPDALMTQLLDIEAGLGRVRLEGGTGYSSRTVDLDIIYYGDLVLHTAKVISPHPRLQSRRFVLEPLCEVCPDFVHPVFHLSNKDLLERCEDKLEVRKLSL